MLFSKYALNQFIQKWNEEICSLNISDCQTKMDNMNL